MLFCLISYIGTHIVYELLLICRYSSEGVLVTVDSAGMVRSLCGIFGTIWTPILDMSYNVSKQHVTTCLLLF